MNQYIKAQILYMKNVVKTFNDSCHLAATKDDGEISKDEFRTLKRIKKASERYLKALDRIK